MKTLHKNIYTNNATVKATILFERMMAFEIQNGGSMSLDNLKFDGASSPDYAANSVITTSKNSMIENYKLFIDKCEFENLIVNHLE